MFQTYYKSVWKNLKDRIHQLTNKYNEKQNIIIIISLIQTTGISKSRNRFKGRSIHIIHMSYEDKLYIKLGYNLG